MAPMLADEHHPENYAERMCEVDIVYQDLAQKDQVEVFLRNCRMFLKKGGYALLAVKSRSIDVVAKPKDVFRKVRTQLEKRDDNHRLS